MPIAAISIGWQGGLVCATLLVGLVVMGFDLVGPDLVFAAMSAVLMAAGVISIKEGASGFSNTGVLTVLVLFVVAEGVSQTGALDQLFRLVLGGRAKGGGPANTQFAQMRLMVPVMVTSAFLNNTPIVALLIPIVTAWSRRNGVPAKQLLIPLSFSTVFGGTCTLIGTSTNLVVSGLQQAKYAKDPSQAVFGFFDITPYGVPYAIWGAVYLILFSKYLLPNSDSDETVDVVTALFVPPGSASAGRPLAETLGTSGARATAVARGSETLPGPLPPSFALAEGDVLYVCGAVSAAARLAQEAALEVVSDAEEAAALAAVAKGEGAPAAAREVESVRASAAASAAAASASAAAAKAAGGGRGKLLSAGGGGGGDLDVEGQQSLAATPPPAPRSALDGADLLEVVVAKGAPLAGTTIRDAGFRSRFGAAVVAVKRARQALHCRFGDVELRPGDVLVLAAGAAFVGTRADEFRANFRRAAPVDGGAVRREFTTALSLPRGSGLAGKTIEDAGLRGIHGLFLFAVDRDNGSGGKETITAVDRGFRLAELDTLWFAGDLDAVAFLRKLPGLEHTQTGQTLKLGTKAVDRRLVQACVCAHGPLSGRTLREVDFRRKYDAVALAVHRGGKQVPLGDLGSVRLAAGDLLVLEAGPAFSGGPRANRAFVLATDVPRSAPPKKNRMWLALLLTALMVGSQILAGVFKWDDRANLWIVATLTAGLMLGFGCLSAEQARGSFDWEVYITIAFAFGISTAMEKTKVARAIAELFAALSRAIGGQTAALTCSYLVTALLSELLTNNAAAALMFPIASSLAEQLGVPQRLMSVAVMLGGSAGWILPYSYQCNLMVYSAGNYRTVDFLKIGAPLTIWLLVGTAIILGFPDQWYIPLAASSAAMALSVAGPVALERFRQRQRERRGEGGAAAPEKA